MNLFQFTGTRKLAHHREWLEAYRRNEVVAPISVEMDLTNNCNYGCPNCVWGDLIAGSRAAVPRDGAFKQIRECASLGVKAIIFSGGGEPLLSPILIDCMRLAKELGLGIGLFTNGLPLTAERAGAVRDHCDWVRVHLDAVSPEAYERRHKVNPSHIVTLEQNIRHLAASESCSVGLGSVVNPDTIAELDGLIALAARTSCSFFQAKHDFELLPFAWYSEWWTEHVVRRLRELEASSAYGNMRFQYTEVSYSRAPAAHKCHIHHLTTAINADSDYSYCKRLRDKPEWAAGNLRQTPLSDILASQKNKELSASVTPQTCGINCPYIELNELIDGVVRGELNLPADDGAPPVHVDFF